MAIALIKDGHYTSIHTFSCLVIQVFKALRNLNLKSSAEQNYSVNIMPDAY